MDRINQTLEQLQKAVNTATLVLQEETRKLETAAVAATGKIMPVKNIEFCKHIGSSIESYGPRSMYSTPSWQSCVAAARAIVPEVLADVEAQHAANLPAIENNKRVYDQVIQLMTNIGIPMSYVTYEFATRRSRTRTRKEETAGYRNDLMKVCKRDDGYDMRKRQLDDFLKQIDTYEKNMKAKDIERERAAEQDRKEKARLTTLGALAHKYGSTPEVSEVLDAILAKDKYLMLGHHLYMNRSDWNEGCSYAESGLSQFTITSDEDVAIAEQIEQRIGENWDGDGRVFRDMEYGYGYLFNKAAKDLKDDYDKLMETGLLTP